METITLTVNGATISARGGSTILEVARQHGLYIPTLCHHDALRPIGACRLCQVEDRQRGVVVPACVTQVTPGMVIDTDTPRVVKNRKNIIRLLLAAHPESCVVCEKGNTCQLRRLAAELGVGSHGLDPMPYHPMVQDLNPFLSRDLSKCIMCAKCIRVDQEVVVEGVIDYNFRGFDAHPATLFDRPLEAAKCTFCGSCLTVCPTGAIAEKHKKRLDHAGARTRSVCSFCACGCAINLEHDHTMVRGVSPDARPHTANGITLCVKGHFGHDYLNHPDRLRTPLVRGADGLRPASWEEALSLVAGTLRDLAVSHGPQSLGFLGSTRSTNEENYLFQKLARAGLGTHNVDAMGRYQWSAVFETFKEATGFAAGWGAFRDIENTETALVIGVDPTQTAPVLGYHLKRLVRNRGGRLIVVDPVATKMTTLAQIWLKPKVNGDLALLRGLIAAIIEEDLVHHDFLAENTTGFEGFSRSFSGVGVADCAADAGVPEADLRRAARLMAESSKAFVVFGHGLAQQAAAPELVRLLLGLMLITGQLGKEGSGLLPVYKDTNTQGALDMGICPGWLPGQVRISDAPARNRYSLLWNTLLPEQPGLDAGAMLGAAGQGRLRGLYVFNENPVAIHPDGLSVKQALAGLDFLVVQDLFLTETASLAHVVLPAAAWAEKGGTTTNLERRVQRLRPAILPPGEFPTDLQVLASLANRLGLSWTYRGVEDVFNEIVAAIPLYKGADRGTLEDRAFFWPEPGLEEVPDTLPHGIGHPDGRAVFPTLSGATFPAVATSPQFPLILMQGHILPHLGAGSRTTRSGRLLRAEPTAFLEVSPEDLKTWEIEPGETVRVVSAKASLEVPVRSSTRLPAGLVFLPASFASARPNLLFPWDWADADKNQPGKHCPVRLEKVARDDQPSTN